MIKQPDCTIPNHSADRFHWSGKLGIIEASDFGQQPMASRVWSDSCDEGFFAHNPKTGSWRLFLCEKVISSVDEVYAWEFACSEDPSIKITVFND